MSDILNEIVEGTQEKISQESIADNTLYEFTDYPIGGITGEQMAAALTTGYSGFYNNNSVYLCIEADSANLYIKNHSYRYTVDSVNDGVSWIDITPWKDIEEKDLTEISAVDENVLYSINDYPIGGITNTQMLNALTDQQSGFYLVNSVYLCLDSGTYELNHIYRFAKTSWVDITPWRKVIEKNLSEITDVDSEALYSVPDYPIGGITNEQMLNALTDAQTGFYKVNSVYMCIDSGTYSINHFYKFSTNSWTDVTPQFSGQIKEKTLSEMESETIEEGTLYAVDDYPIGGITNAQMANALKSEELGFYQVGSCYLCTDDGDYIKHHFYKFSYDSDTDTYSWYDTKAGADIDSELSTESANPVQNKVITNALDTKVTKTGDENIYGTKSFDVRPKLGISDILPSDYQEVEYIQSTGTQYIDTNVIADNNTRIVADFQATLVTTDSMLFEITYNNNRLLFAMHSKFWALRGSSSIQQPTGDLLKHTLDFNNGSTYILDNTTYGSFSSTFTNSSNYTLPLFAGNNTGTITRYGKFKLYNLKIYSNQTTLVRNFIPCYKKSDDTIGLYDTVNSVFYANAGTGVFTKGENVYRGIDFATVDDVSTAQSTLQTQIDNKVSLTGNEVIDGVKSFKERPQVGEVRLPSEYTECEYIESNGTQYIDSNIPLSTRITKYEASYHRTTSEAKQILFGCANSGDSLYSYFDYCEQINAPKIYYLNAYATFSFTYGAYDYNTVISYKDGTVTCNLNDEIISFSSTNTPTGDEHYFIFASRGASGSAIYYSKVRLFSMKIESDSGLIRDLVPCYRNSDNEVGLYDLVNSVFYTNSGSGVFTKGDDVLTGEALALQSEIPEIDANPETTAETLTGINIKGTNYKIDYAPYKITSLTIDDDNINITIE